MSAKPKPLESFRFRLDQGDSDICEYLESLPDRERSQTVKQLIRTALREAKVLEDINAKTNLILETLTKSS